ncbi:hypothetical protein [Pseudorhodobacter sp.]|uniref:hypothetical protein n=1 Tax=Pseudorhodobacter sp. TaxID=1934400 RepID=UPI002649817A|nr:hypothetical protein [Pseudorhodobacter sp.]MDN5786828.1 hypothetical protein [Pseudorhodobacter sp.]
MRNLVIGSGVLLLLAACGGGVALGPADRGDNGNAVCMQQSQWAQSGKVDGGDIIITCPGYARPGY